MKMNDKLLLSCFLLAVIGFSVSLTPKAHPSDLGSTSMDANQTVQQFEGYKTWTRVNPKPFLLESYVSRMCAPATAQLKDDSPHKNKFIFVYVNEPGRKAMMTEMNPQFPQGSVIVKEKLASQNSSSPELLTVMTKREKGFNPASNDWEFLVLSGDTKTVQAQGKLENCIACHTAQRGNDFVFRNYLPKEALQNLK
jgi:hypothetical protein